MTNDFPKPMGDDDQPTDRTLRGVPGPDVDQDMDTASAARTGSAYDYGKEDADRAQPNDPRDPGAPGDVPGRLPSVVDLEDEERFDVDNPAKPGIDDYTD